MQQEESCMNLAGDFTVKRHIRPPDSLEGYFLNYKVCKAMSEFEIKEKVAPIGVVIPCYNCEDTLYRALESVEEQTLKPKEVIIVNDGSIHSAFEKIQKICYSRNATAFKIVIANLDRNRGPGVARNVGWQTSSCEYIAFLDADDVWHPRKLEIQYGWMKGRPDVLMTGHQSCVISHGTDLASINLPLQWKAIRVTPIPQLFSNRFHTRSVMIKNNIPFRFTENRANGEDYELWLEIVLSKFAAWRLELPLSFTYKAQYGSGGLSGRLWQMEKKEIASYFVMYRKGLVPSPIFIILLPFSYIKYLRRVILSHMRILIKKE